MLGCKAACDKEGRLLAIDLQVDWNAGSVSSYLLVLARASKVGDGCVCGVCVQTQRRPVDRVGDGLLEDLGQCLRGPCSPVSHPQLPNQHPDNHRRPRGDPVLLAAPFPHAVRFSLPLFRTPFSLPLFRICARLLTRRVSGSPAARRQCR